MAWKTKMIKNLSVKLSKLLVTKVRMWLLSKDWLSIGCLTIISIQVDLSMSVVLIASICKLLLGETLDEHIWIVNYFQAAGVLVQFIICMSWCKGTVVSSAIMFFIYIPLIYWSVKNLKPLLDQFVSHPMIRGYYPYFEVSDVVAEVMGLLLIRQLMYFQPESRYVHSVIVFSIIFSILLPVFAALSHNNMLSDESFSVILFCGLFVPLISFLAYGIRSLYMLAEFNLALHFVMCFLSPVLWLSSEPLWLKDGDDDEVGDGEERTEDRDETDGTVTVKPNNEILTRHFETMGLQGGAWGVAPFLETRKPS